jgi:methylmalonyl-CoA mutase C-terminal domain/subunit
MLGAQFQTSILTGLTGLVVCARVKIEWVVEARNSRSRTKRTPLPNAFSLTSTPYETDSSSAPKMRPIRVLVAKPGLDGHDRGAKVVAAALRDAGMEVIYTGLHQTPEMIATAAVQEDVDVIGLSILSGAHMTLIPRVQELVAAQGRSDILITGGGIIPREDMDALQARGVGRLFGPGTPTSDLIDYIKEWFASREEGAAGAASHTGG